MKKLVDPLTYLKTNTVKQLVSLWKYMILLIKQDRPADQKHNTVYFILGEQWSILTVHDMRTALVNAGLENHISQTTSGTPMSNFTSPSSSAFMRSPTNWRFASFKKAIKMEPLHNQSSEMKVISTSYRWIFFTAKSHDVSEILDPTFTPGLPKKNRSCLKPSKPPVQSLQGDSVD